jgi:hypothetical protein
LKTPKIKVKKTKENILILDFKTQREVCSTFVRMQEFYESDFEGIRDNYFTLKEYKERYREWKGKFSYYTDWAGFNVPGNKVIEFFSLFKRLTKKEKVLKELIFKNVDINKKFYVVATYNLKENIEVLRHELSHALFYLDDGYKSKSEKLVKKYPKLKKLKKSLLDMGYTSKVLIDECQAYLSTTPKEEFMWTFEFGIGNNKKFKCLFNDYYEDLNI